MSVHVHNGRRTLRHDPTRTALIRRRFQAEMRRRFGRLKQAVFEFMVTLDALGLGNPPGTAASLGLGLPDASRMTIALRGNHRGQISLLAKPLPREFQFTTDAAKVQAFRMWLQEQILFDLLSVKDVADPGKPWTAKYIESAYKRGKVNAFAATRAQADLFEKADFAARASEKFIQEAFGQPESLKKVELLFTRSFSELEGISDSMGQQLSRILANGLVEGRGARDIASQMTSKIDGITNQRALVLARTEVIHAHAEGQLDTFTELGVEEIGVQSEWSTAGDDRVCPECEKMEGKIFSVEDAHGLIPLHPNCRCTWIPHIPKHLLP